MSRTTRSRRSATAPADPGPPPDAAARPGPSSPPTPGRGARAGREPSARRDAEAQAALQALRFLTALYGEAPAGQLTLWTGRAKTTYWPESLAAMAETAVKLARTDDVYYGVGPRKARLARGRGGARDVLALPALWADLDVRAPAHKRHDLPPDKASTAAILEDFPLPASALVASGYGYHAYWFLEEPFANNDLEASKQLLAQFGQALLVISERHGWRLDTSVFEPARVLRLPGTFNRKERRPRPVRIERLDAAARYPVAALLAAAEAIAMPPQPPASPPGPAGRRPGADR